MTNERMLQAEIRERTRRLLFELYDPFGIRRQQEALRPFITAVMRANQEAHSRLREIGISLSAIQKGNEERSQ